MGLDLQFAREETKNMAFHSAEGGVSLMETKFGPLITAKQALEPEGKWEALRAARSTRAYMGAAATPGNSGRPGSYDR
jgi:hypothetical protein